MRPARAARLSRAVKRAIVAHARAAAPDECCGLLVGTGRRVDLAVPMRNAESRPRTGFRLDPSEHIAVRRVLRRLTPELQIVGVYHSHPAGPARPSARDLAESHYPEWLFAIVGRAGRAFMLFEIRRGVARSVKVVWRR